MKIDIELLDGIASETVAMIKKLQEFEEQLRGGTKLKLSAKFTMTSLIRFRQELSWEQDKNRK